MMRRAACLGAVCLAALLPLQACSPKTPQGAYMYSHPLMQEISDSRNMRLWDQLTAEEYKHQSPSWLKYDQDFMQKNRPLGEIVSFPKQDIRSIKVYLMNSFISMHGGLKTPERVKAYVPEWSLKVRAYLPPEEARKVHEFFYDIPVDKIEQTMEIIKKVRAKNAEITDARIQDTDYRLAIEITYENGQQIHLMSNRRHSLGVYTEGAVLGMGKQDIPVDLSFRDLNILIQSIDPEVFAFYEMSFLKKWESLK